MGVRIARCQTQSHTKAVVGDLDCEVYLDDCGIWTDGSFDEPLALVDKVFTRFRDNGRKYNPLTKCAMTPEGVKPRQKKMDAVLKMSAPPKNQKEV